MSFISAHLYGFTLGVAIVVAWTLLEKLAQKHNLPEKILGQLIGVTLAGGLLGARIYHVITDFYLYQGNLVDVVKIWGGGMSIIGAVLGITLALLIPSHFFKSLKNHVWKYLDMLALVLPIGQVIGRWGNFFNQELYGLPTDLPWGIFISPQHRLIGYENFTHFHPLFLYEILLMLLFAGVVWFGPKFGLFSDKKIGSGFWFKIYLFYYSFIRFWLDFIRINKSHLNWTFLGKNQVFLLFVMVMLLVQFSVKKIKEK